MLISHLLRKLFFLHHFILGQYLSLNMRYVSVHSKKVHTVLWSNQQVWIIWLENWAHSFQNYYGKIWINCCHFVDFAIFVFWLLPWITTTSIIHFYPVISWVCLFFPWLEVSSILCGAASVVINSVSLFSSREDFLCQLWWILLDG